MFIFYTKCKNLDKQVWCLKGAHETNINNKGGLELPV